MNASSVSSELLIAKPRTDCFRQASLRSLEFSVRTINCTSFGARHIGRTWNLSIGTVSASDVDIFPAGRTLRFSPCFHLLLSNITSEFQQNDRKSLNSATC